MSKIEIIVNASGGSFVQDVTELSLVNAFAAIGLDANIILARSGENIVNLASTAVEGEAQIIVAGGGDGTISSIAAEVMKAGKTLGVLPLGTLNNFSKDMQIPQHLADAIAVIAAGHVETIDVAEVNGRIFINNSSIGLYPRMVRRRERQQRLGRGKWISAFWASLRMFKLSPFLKVRMTIDGKEFLRKTPFVFVGNNEYEMDLYKIGRRTTLSGGKLSVYFLHRGGRAGVIKLLFKTIFGGLRQWRDFEAVSTDEIVIHTRKNFLSVAFDGEVGVMESPLHYKTMPAALKVIVPAPKIAEPDAENQTA